MFVKVCGLSTPESVREAVDAGADAVGFVLTASPRVVSPSQVASLLSGVPKGVSPIGVFRDEPVADAIAIARAAGLEWIQLHGQRSRADVATVHDAGMKLVRAVTMGAGQDEFDDWGEDLLLIDAAVPGSGKSWDYASVADLPVLQPTKIAFGGPDLATLYLTSAGHRHMPGDQPLGDQAGGLFAIDTDFRGIAEPQLAF